MMAVSITALCSNVLGSECGLSLLAATAGESALQGEASASDLMAYATQRLQCGPKSPAFHEAISHILALGRSRGEQLLASREFESVRALLLHLVGLFQTHGIDRNRYLRWTSALLAEANKQLGNREEALQDAKVALSVLSSDNHHRAWQKRSVLRCYSELAPNEGVDEFVRGVQEIDAVVHTLVATEMLSRGQSQLALRKIERMRGLDLSDKELVKQRLVTHNLSAELVESLWSERRDGVEGGKKRKWAIPSPTVPLDEVLHLLLASIDEGSGVHTQLQRLAGGSNPIELQRCIVQGIEQLMDRQKFETARAVVSALLRSKGNAHFLRPATRIALDCYLVRCELHANCATEAYDHCMDAITQVTTRGRYGVRPKWHVIATYFEVMQMLGGEDALVQRMGSVDSQLHTLAAVRYLSAGKLACAMRKIRTLHPPVADLPLIHERLAPLLEERGLSVQQFLCAPFTNGVDCV